MMGRSKHLQTSDPRHRITVDTKCDHSFLAETTPVHSALATYDSEHAYDATRAYQYANNCCIELKKDILAEGSISAKQSWMLSARCQDVNSTS